MLTLLRPLIRASISMHCGRLSYVVAFHEYVDPDQDIAEESDEETDTVVSYLLLNGLLCIGMTICFFLE